VHGVYSSAPPRQDFQFANVQAEIDALPSRECLPEYRGDAEIESYTVMYAGEEPAIAHLALRTPAGERVWANSEDRALMQSMIREEFCGRPARIDGDGQVAVTG